MDLYRRKVWGDRFTWVVVAGATVAVVNQWLTRGGDVRLYILYGWSALVAWLVFVSELRLGRARPRLEERSVFAGWSALVGEERLAPDGEREQVWTGALAGALYLERTGVRWVPKDPDRGQDEFSFGWSDIYSWRLVGVLPLVPRASGYLTLSLFGGRELTFSVHGQRAWRRALREGAIVGPVNEAEERKDELVDVPVQMAEASDAPQPVAPVDTTPVDAPTAPAQPPVTDDDAPPPPQPPAPATYEAVIGIECHVELSTASKMFCGCPTTFGATPNTQICAVCTGQPGSLPVVNEGAVERALAIACALNCRIAPESVFHRKNYPYPDMPKNYQISQYDIPLASDGYLEFEVDGETRRVGINRVHLEEDTGKTEHVGASGRIGESEGALIDYNRAGIPLVEIVTEPDMATPAEARAYASELRALLLALGVSDVRMEEGSLRCDANISIRPAGESELGTKTEVKNMNSLRSIERALAHEIERQTEVVSGGGRITQETRHFDESRNVTIGGRAKEYSSDYRYFTDPDLVPLAPSQGWIDRVRSTLPELPLQRRRRLAADHELTAVDAQTLTSAPGLSEAFEQAVAAYGGEGKAIARWYLGELAQLGNERGCGPHEVGVDPGQVAELQRLVDDGAVSISLAKGEVLKQVVATGKAPADVVSEAGLEQISDTGQLGAIADEVIAANADLVEQIRGGKQGAINALVGQVMKQTKGQADAKAVRDLLAERIG